MPSDWIAPLDRRLDELEAQAQPRPRALAVAVRDYADGRVYERADLRPFHAASTIKIAVLVGVFAAAAAGRVALDARLHVRNRFRSVLDGRPFRVHPDRDADGAVYAARGKTLRVRELLEPMITTSSNLATNLLVDLVGIDALRVTLATLGIDGVDLRRGVEDEAAYQAGIHNRVTARGLRTLLEAIVEERAVSAPAARAMLEILLAQRFNRGIPAGLPDGARVAHKTGEISTVAHDAGVVFLPERRPYVLVVLSEWAPEAEGRHALLAGVSRAVYEALGTPADAERTSADR